MSHAKENSNHDAPTTRLVGLLAQFEDSASLVHACDQARQAGYKEMDAYTPFPVHGIDPAIGIRRTRLPFLVLAIGLTALAVGLGMQYYTNNDVSTFGFFPGYRFLISGKPNFSIPANIPVTFEVIVLSSAFAAFLGMWALNGLPRLANPLHRISRFKRATNDKFFMMIETKDEKFDRGVTEDQLQQWGASFIEECREELSDWKMPAFVRMAGILIFFLCLLPPAAIFRMAGMTNRAPRMHIVPDMDWQDKNKTQTVSPNIGTALKPMNLFADGRVMREPIPGTIARGRLFDDSEYYLGIQAGSAEVSATLAAGVYTGVQEGEAAEVQDAGAPAPVVAAAQEPEPNWVTSFPERVVVNRELIERGRERFEIYCVVCHGYAGNGDGLVNQRALSLAASGKAAWTTAKSLHDPDAKNNEKNPVGRIFDTISNGRSSMGPYKDQISVEDRWAIVAYVKALQGTGIQPDNPAIATADATPAASSQP